MTELFYTLLALRGLACQVKSSAYEGYLKAFIASDNTIHFWVNGCLVVATFEQVINVSVNVEGITLTLNNLSKVY